MADLWPADSSDSELAAGAPILPVTASSDPIDAQPPVAPVEAVVVQRHGVVVVPVVPAPAVARTANESLFSPPVVDAALAGPMWKVTFASVPGGAKVLVDGVPIGTAPVLNYALKGGSYTVTMTYPTGESIVRTIETGSRAPKRYVWDQQGGGTWNSY